MHRKCRRRSRKLIELAGIAARELDEVGERLRGDVRGPATSTFGITPTSATGARSRRRIEGEVFTIDCTMATCG